MPGFDTTFVALDAYVDRRFAEVKNYFGKVSYGNWYPFKSPRGVWMAFHGRSYSDVRVVNLETREVVFDKPFYSAPSGPTAHCNTHTYVPSFVMTKAGKYDTIVVDNDFDEWLADGSLTEDIFDKLEYAPYAFNASTIWAADYELYIDTLDLREIDDGKLYRVKVPHLRTLPIGTKDIRQFIRLTGDVCVPIRLNDKETEEEFEARKAASTPRSLALFDVHMLVEDNRDRFDFATPIYDMYQKEKERYYIREDRAPWQK